MPRGRTTTWQGPTPSREQGCGCCLSVEGLSLAETDYCLAKQASNHACLRPVGVVEGRFNLLC